MQQPIRKEQRQVLRGTPPNPSRSTKRRKRKRQQHKLKIKKKFFTTKATNIKIILKRTSAAKKKDAKCSLYSRSILKISGSPNIRILRLQQDKRESTYQRMASLRCSRWRLTIKNWIFPIIA